MEKIPADGAPGKALALKQAEDHCQQPQSGQRDPDRVEPRADTGADVGYEGEGAGDGDRPDGDVDVEDPAPAPLGDDPAAEGRPGDRGQRCQAAPDAKS